MSTNAPSRIYYQGKASDDDLLFQIDSSKYRLYEPENDPSPIYEEDEIDPGENEKDGPEVSEFAHETDLKNFLSKNLTFIEDGLVLYDEEGISGIEFPSGGRFIDILAKSKDDSLVVIELKISRGYDRVVG